jgi:hypothetical protein
MHFVMLYVVYCRVTLMSPQLQIGKDLWEAKLSEFFTGGLRKESKSRDTISHLLAVGDVYTVKDQFELLGSLPNHPKVYYITKKGSKSTSTKVNFYQHLLTNPDMYDEEGVWKTTHKLPTSARNRLILYTLNSEYGTLEDREALVHQVSLMLKVDRDENESLREVRESSFQDASVPGGEALPPVPKKRRTKTRVVSVSRARLCQHTGQDIEIAQNFAAEHRTQFQVFCESMMNDGCIVWREHSEDRDVLIMSSYSESSGLLLPHKFVQLTSRVGDEGVVLMKCTCVSYLQMRSAGLMGELDLEADEEVAVDSDGIICMHCRLFKDKLVGKWGLLLDDSQPKSNFLSRVTVQQEQAVILVGSVWPYSATHFSVLGAEDIAIVHVTFTTSRVRVRVRQRLSYQMPHQVLRY